MFLEAKAKCTKVHSFNYFLRPINVERNKFNGLAGNYNIIIQKIPTNFVANFRGFKAMALYKSDAGSENAPDVNFNF